MKKVIYLILLICYGDLVLSQTISPQVINAGGDTRPVGSTGITITDNIGEPFTETLNQNSEMITQGFIQPEAVSVGGFSATVKVTNVTCLDKNDGEISVKVTKSPLAVNYQVTYSWTPSSTCTTRCDSLVGLMPQTYTLNMFITYTNSVGSVKNDTLTRLITVNGTNEICKIKIYNGISANGDGQNDVLTIDNIEEFPKNRIMIFNRWGTQLADIKGYNMATNSWPEKDKLANLPPSTYFYILDLGDGSKPIKGWIELFKN
jgi:gliding motility-associated-like protein